MADILIRGMGMPKGCDDCKLRYRHQGAYCVDYCFPFHKTVDPWTFGRDGNGDKPDWCPLVPLPEGHGRLGDLDKINASLGAMIEIDHNQKAAPYSWAYAYTEMQSILDDAPTIVPAEGGGE